jgi:flagellar hook-associated protein 3 FlgL
MTRISENQLVKTVMSDVANNRQQVAKHSEELSSGLKVADPGDSFYSGTISQLNNVVERVEGFKNRVATVRGYIDFQNDTVTQVGDLIIRAREIAEQAANETNSVEARLMLAEEVFQIRDHLVSLANSQYQGSYVFGGLNDDVAPYSQDVYLNGTGEGLERWVYNNVNGNDMTKTVRITDNLTMTVNTPGQNIFNNAIYAMEQLGRSLQGFDTVFVAGVPDGTGNAYTFPADYDQQTLDIQAALDRLETARTNDVMPELVNMAGRMARLDTAESLLELSEVSTNEVLSKLQDTDMIESASNLSIAETALQASLSVTSQILKLSILNYI